MLIYKNSANCLAFGTSENGSVAIFGGFSEISPAILKAKYPEFCKFFSLKKLLKNAVKRKFRVELASSANYLSSLELDAVEVNYLWGKDIKTNPPRHEGEREVAVVNGLYVLRNGDTLMGYLIGLGGSTGRNYLLLGGKICAEVQQNASIKWFIDSAEALRLARTFPFRPRTSGYFPPCDEEPSFEDVVEVET